MSEQFLQKEGFFGHIKNYVSLICTKEYSIIFNNVYTKATLQKKNIKIPVKTARHSTTNEKTLARVIISIHESRTQSRVKGDEKN